MGVGWIIAAVDAVARETTLFAGIGFLLGGLDDLAVDLAWIGIALTRRRPASAPLMEAYPRTPARRIAVFVAAWDESAVIGAMVRTALARFDHADYRLYIGTYPNDRATVDAVAAVAADDPRVRLVINDRDGPTTKADCLNAVWRALKRDEARDGVRAAAVVLHDAEDFVHPGELRVFDALIGPYAVVQLPVLPLVDHGARLVSGHYADEFAEAHGKQMVVRQTLGAGLPLAGVGCAIARDMLGRIADARGGEPFDAGSIVEDYELGLYIAALGGRGVLARVRECAGGPLVAVRAYFPATVRTAVRQKARWMTGIALAGWDRVGWSRAFDWREHWMRMRDRRAPLAVLVLATAYVALVSWSASVLIHMLTGGAPGALPGAVFAVLQINGVLLVWRLASRAAFTGAAYGWQEALWSLPRALVGNWIAVLAARRAMTAYVRSLRGRALTWDKTRHVFPEDVQVEVMIDVRSATGHGRPIRFLGAVATCWIGLRMIMLWPPDSAASLMPTLGPIPGAVAQAASRRPEHAPGPVPGPGAPSRWIVAAAKAPVAPVRDLGRGPVLHAVPIALPLPPFLTPPSDKPAPILPGLPLTLSAVRRTHPPSRWSGSAWLAARGGAGLAPGALGGQLGGSQAGVRIAYLLSRAHRVALVARVATPLGAGLREAALGVEWQPTRLPLRLVVERRFALGAGTGGPAVGLVGGINPLPLPLGFRLDGYGQAGVIRRTDTEPYCDGALHAAHPLARLGGLRFDLGAGAWGAAQRGAARLDLGPSLGTSIPLGKQRVRLTLDWRERVAGDAHPGSGPALTLGADF